MFINSLLLPPYPPQMELIALPHWLATQHCPAICRQLSIAQLTVGNSELPRFCPATQHCTAIDWQLALPWH
jgi:hypothetical protein